MKNKIKITVTEKHLDAALKSDRHESSCICRCVMAKAVREQWRPNAKFGKTCAWDGWFWGRPEIRIMQSFEGIVMNIVHLFDNGMHDELRACLPVTLEFIEA